MVLLLAAGLPIFFCTHAILRMWVGPAYAENATILVQLLVVANIIRICVSPYIIAMISTGGQRRIIFVPLLEGAVNLAASVIAGYYLGAVGVALGTLVGSVVSLVGHTRYTMRKNIAIDLKAGDYLFNSLLRPTLCAAPIIGMAASWHYLPVFLQPGLSTIAGSLSLVLFFAFCLTPSERHRLEIQLRSVCFRND
jgi:O-antigen/teichoic acid export membrane protein